MLVMQVIVFHSYTKFEVCRPSRFEDMGDFSVTVKSVVLCERTGTVHHCHRPMDDS